MITVLHSLGLAVFAWILAAPALGFMKSVGAELKPPLFWMFAVALATFLLTL